MLRAMFELVLNTRPRQADTVLALTAMELTIILAIILTNEDAGECKGKQATISLWAHTAILISQWNIDSISTHDGGDGSNWCHGGWESREPYSQLC